MKPHALGISFYIEGESPGFEVTIEAAAYEGDPDHREASRRTPWTRSRILVGARESQAARCTEENATDGGRHLAGAAGRL